MLKKYSLLPIFLFCLPLYALPSMLDTSALAIPAPSNDIAINNRILLKVNGKVISMLDVVKKMDLLFYRQYPEYASSSLARYQFYQSSWKAILQSVIDDELILADAAEKKVNVSDGDVREELEDIFGPDVVINIDKIGLTYEEAWDLLKKELTVQRMNSMLVRAPALNDVGPKSIRDTYEDFAKKNPAETAWVYRVFTIRSSDKERVEKLAEEALHLIRASELSLEDVAASLQQREEGVQITLSEEYNRKEKELSDAHKETLSAIAKAAQKGVSMPIIQAGKNNEIAARLFYLKEKCQVNPPAFDELKDEIQSELLRKAVAHHSKAYLEKLRRHYGITREYVAQMVPDNFQPFSMQ